MTLRILLIEDDPDDEALLRAMLEEGDLAVEVAAERLLTLALRRLAAETFNLVFLDMSLPDSWGAETLRRLRAAFPDLPVVLMTGANVPEIAAQAAQEGAVGCLFKHQLDHRALWDIVSRFRSP